MTRQPDELRGALMSWGQPEIASSTILHPFRSSAIRPHPSEMPTDISSRHRALIDQLPEDVERLTTVERRKPSPGRAISSGSHQFP